MKYKLKNEIPHGLGCAKKLLELRGIKDVEYYLNVDELVLNDYLLLDNIVTGAECLKKHIDKKSNIFIIIDSDSDGYNSAAIMYMYIKSIDKDANVFYKMHDGKQHGIIIDMVPEDTDLLIVPDAGRFTA